MLVDYMYYKDDYYGDKVEEDKFNKYSLIAEEYIDYITFTKYKKVIDEIVITKVKRAICMIVDMRFDLDKRIDQINLAQEEIVQRGVKSETVKSHQITYVDVNYKSEKELTEMYEKDIYQAVQRTLVTTGLLYRGIPNV